MKVRVTSKLPEVQIGSSAIKGKELTGFSDNVGFAAYEITINPGESVRLVSPFGDDFNHIYYCFNGGGAAKCGDAAIAFAKDTMVALTGKMEMEVSASAPGEMRIFATYVKADVETPAPSAPLVKRLSDVIGGERDVDWQKGRGRRLLVKSDGFNISLHNTLVYSEHALPLCYRNNVELAHYVRGDVKYCWNNDTESYHFRQISPADGDGCTFLMDQNDAHVLHAGPLECEVLCLFYPPLKGTETLDLTKGKCSSF